MSIRLMRLVCVHAHTVVIIITSVQRAVHMCTAVALYKYIVYIDVCMQNKHRHLSHAYNYSEWKDIIRGRDAHHNEHYWHTCSP